MIPIYRVNAARISAQTFLNFSKQDWELFHHLISKIEDWFDGKYMSIKANDKDMGKAFTFLNNVVPFTSVQASLYRAFWITPPVEIGRTYMLTMGLKPIQSWSTSYDGVISFANGNLLWPRGLNNVIAIVGKSEVGKYALSGTEHLRRIVNVLEKYARALKSSLRKESQSAAKELNKSLLILSEIVQEWDYQQEIIVDIPNNMKIPVTIVDILRT